MSGSKEPPHLPDVVDEAGASPSWVPLLGFGLLVAFALLIALRQAVAELMPEPPAAAAAADGGVAADGEGEEAAAAAGAAAPAAVKAAPAEADPHAGHGHE